MTDSVEIIRASAVEMRQVLRMTLSAPGQTAADIEHHVSGFVQYARRMGLDLSWQWMVRAAGRPITACTCIESPGRAVMLFLPDSGVIRAGRETLESLLSRVISEQSARDNRLAQCLIDPSDDQTRRALESAGFFEIAELVYMESEVAGSAAGSATRDPARTSVDWLTYRADLHATFRDLIAATYEASLDCPKLAGLRDMEDVIAGHKAAGLFDPARWLLAVADGIPAGCILLGENPLRPQLEIVYMGVHPAMRGRGIGAILLHEGFRLAQVEQFEKVTLAVDAANAPAWALYKKFGFQTTTRRRAMILRLHPTSIRS